LHTSWDRTGSYLGDVRLPASQQVVTSDDELICISCSRNARTIYGQWRCDTDDGWRYEYIQNLTLRSSFEEDSKCSQRFSGSFYAR
jgi:hypothetical protein